MGTLKNQPILETGYPWVNAGTFVSSDSDSRMIIINHLRTVVDSSQPIPRIGLEKTEISTKRVLKKNGLWLKNNFVVWSCEPTLALSSSSFTWKRSRGYKLTEGTVGSSFSSTMTCGSSLCAAGDDGFCFRKFEGIGLRCLTSNVFQNHNLAAL